MSFVLIDFEARGSRDLREVGAHAYWEEAEILMVSVSEPTGPVEVRASVEIRAVDVLVSWGDFDVVGYRRWVDPDFPYERTINLSSVAAYCGLPAGLDAFCAELGLGRKDPAGEKLIQTFTLPDPETGKFREMSDEDRAAFESYCHQDGVLLQKCFAALRDGLDEWLRHVGPAYCATQRMNELGLSLDMRAVDAAAKVAPAAKNALLDECQERFGFKQTQIEKVRDNLGAPDTQRATLEALRFDDPDLEWLRTTRLIVGSSTQTTKFETMQRRHVRGRSRGEYLFFGAHTGRNTSKGVQVHNLPRGSTDESVFERLYRGEAPSLQEIIANTRGFILAPEGRTHVVADYSGLEARLSAWLCGEKKLLDTFAQGRDPYREFASKLYGAAPGAVTSEQRSVGKMAILAEQYGVGPKTMCANAQKMGAELSFSGAENLIAAYKHEYPGIPDFWRALERAAYAVTQTGAISLPVNRHVKVERGGRFLCLVLPSGRPLRYWLPRIARGLTFYQFKQPTKKNPSGRVLSHLWGGSMLNNLAQATAADLRNDALTKMDAAGLEVVGECHDELIVECDEADGEAVLAQMLEIMRDAPDWAPKGLIDAEGFVSRRYRK